MLLTIFLFFMGSIMVLLGVVGEIAVILGVSDLPLSAIEFLLLFAGGGFIECMAVLMFLKRGPSAMMKTMENALDESIDRSIGRRGRQSDPLSKWLP